MTDEAKMLRGIIDHLRATMATTLDQLGVNYDQDASATVLLDELVTEAKALNEAHARLAATLERHDNEHVNEHVEEVAAAAGRRAALAVFDETFTEVRIRIADLLALSQPRQTHKEAA